MSDFPIESFPSREAIAWATSKVGPRARYIRGRRLKGGVTSAVHELAIADANGTIRRVVLRRWVGEMTTSPYAPSRIEYEARSLEALEATPVPAPRLIATDPTGAETGDEPALLMTKVPGRTVLEPTEECVRQMAALVPVVNATPLIDGIEPYGLWFDVEKAAAQPWVGRPDAWQVAIETIRTVPEPRFVPGFTHRDYQHFNMLWSRGKLVGVVDWVAACIGPPDIDVGHCRLAFAALFSADWAERFRLAYEAEAGHRLDPWFDIVEILRYSEDWKAFVPIQVAGRMAPDVAGMSERVVDLLTLAAARF